jgi:hypothetical protein
MESVSTAGKSSTFRIPRAGSDNTRKKEPTVRKKTSFLRLRAPRTTFSYQSPSRRTLIISPSHTPMRSSVRLTRPLSSCSISSRVFLSLMNLAAMGGARISPTKREAKRATETAMGM